MFTCCQLFPYLCNHQIVISITVRSPDISYIECTRMPSPTYQYVINPVVNLLTNIGPGVFKKVSARKVVLLATRFFDVAKFTILPPLSLLSWCKLLFPIVGLNLFSLPNFPLKSPNRCSILRKIIKNLPYFLIKIVFSIITFLLTWGMHI